MFSDDKGQSLTHTDLFAARLILDYVYLARPTVPNQGVDTFTHNTKVYTGLIWAGIALGRKGFLSSPVVFHCPGRLANQEDRFAVGFQVLVSLFG